MDFHADSPQQTFLLNLFDLFQSARKTAKRKTLLANGRRLRSASLGGQGRGRIDSEMKKII